ncbi:hypothetical protein [Actinoplanes sp. NPDC051851]|uniref:hypothetical protein n=1 Tax=Actinoplanes sp. NPDC051851 TaxID=3154753 RepID=UPI0034145B0C
MTGVAATVLLWPGDRALDFHALDDPSTYQPAVPVGSDWSDAEVIGDRAYFATSDDGAVGVVAVDTESRKQLWQSTAAGVADRWSEMVALPGAVALLTETDYTTSTWRLVVLDGATGTKRWDRQLGGTDDVRFGDGVAVVVDRVGGRLLGLRLTDGGQAWEQRNTDGATGSTIVPVTTPADLNGPARVSGRAFAPALDDDRRIVQIAADRSARVVDMVTGEVTAGRPEVGYTTDEMIAHDGRLFVQESSSERLLAYDLDAMGEPDVLHTVPSGSQADQLTPCGDDRICFVETAGYDRDKAEVVAIDAVERTEVWRRAVPGAEALVPVGGAVLAIGAESTTLLGADGAPAWDAERGVAVRLDAGNVLRFSDTLSTSVGDRTLVGAHVGDEPVQIGLLRDVRSGTCAWNTSVLACVTEKGLVIQQFAG